MSKNSDKDRILALVNNYISEYAQKPNPDVAHVTYPLIDAEDIEAVVSAALDGWFTEGGRSIEFSNKLQSYIGLNNCTLCNSGSSANLLAISACREHFPKKKYVITCALAFPTTVFPIIQCGYTPLFVDVDPLTLNPNPDVVIACIKDNIDNLSGIILTHTLGFPIDKLHTIAEICKEYNIFFIEDCCDSLGSRYNKQHVGTFGDAMTLSFFPAHHISTGEGGAVLTKKYSLGEEVRRFSNWGRGCFPAGTMVRMPNNEVEPIEVVSVGDTIVNHLGKLDEVTDTYSRDYTGDLYTIKARTIPIIKVTSEHPFYVYNKVSSSFEWVLAKDLSKDTHWLVEHKVAQVNVDEYYRGILETLYYTEKYCDTFNTPITSGVLRLIGYYLSQGNLASGLKGKSGYKENKYKFYRVDFTFNSSKTDVISNLVELMFLYFGVVPSYRYIGGATIISFKSRKAFEFFEQNCSRISYNKKISDAIFSLARPQDLLEIVVGFMLGDGTINWQGCSIFSTSPILFSQLRYILLSNDIVGSLTVRTKDKHHSSVVNGNLVEQKHDLYTLAIYGKYAERFLSVAGISNFKSKTPKTFVRDLGDYFAYPILSIDIEKVESLPVYNFEVKNEHSYHAGFVAVHNCSCLPGQDNSCKRRFSWDYKNLPFGYDHKYIFTRLGYNLKMTELQAALGISQMQKLYWLVNKRKFNYLHLLEYLGRLNTDRFRFGVSIPSNVNVSPFGFPITVLDDSNVRDIILYLESVDIRTRPLFAGNITRQPVMEDIEYLVYGTLEGADYVTERTFWVGCHPSMTQENLYRIISTFSDIVNGGVV